MRHLYTLYELLNSSTTKQHFDCGMLAITVSQWSNPGTADWHRRIPYLVKYEDHFSKKAMIASTKTES